MRQNALTFPQTPEPESAAADTTSSTIAMVVPDCRGTSPKVVALHSIGAILNDFLVSKTIHLLSFAAARETFVTHIRDALLLDSRSVSAPAPCLPERAPKATTAAPSDAERLRQSLAEIWEKTTWAKCDDMGAVIMRRASAAVYRATGTWPRAVHARELSRIRGCHQVRAEYQQDARRLRMALVTHRFS